MTLESLLLLHSMLFQNVAILNLIIISKRQDKPSKIKQQYADDSLSYFYIYIYIYNLLL